METKENQENIMTIVSVGLTRPAIAMKLLQIGADLGI